MTSCFHDYSGITPTPPHHVTAWCFHNCIILCGWTFPAWQHFRYFRFTEDVEALFMMWSFSLWPQNFSCVSVSEKNSRLIFFFFIWLHSNIGIFASVQIIWLWVERWMTWYLKTCILFVYRMGPKCSVYVNVQSVLFVLTFSDEWDVNEILAKALTEKDTQDVRL